MRRIVLDTETTGLDPEEGHRVIEAAALELVDRRLTGAAFHRHFNPEREVEAGAERVHGMSHADLMNEPRFADLADEFLAFIDGAELIIHNAPFDLAFLDAELVRCSRPPLSGRHPVLDTLELARRRHPGQPQPTSTRSAPATGWTTRPGPCMARASTRSSSRRSTSR